MAANKTWIEKADQTVQDFIDDGGFLNDEQTAEIFEIAIKESVAMQLVTTKPMTASKFEITKMQFAGRVLRGATENQALAKGDRSKVDNAKTVLDVKEFIAEVRIPYGALEDHVSQNRLMEVTRNLLGKALARDIEFVAFNGDTSNTGTTVDDRLVSIIDGFIVQATSNVVVAGGARATKSIFKQMRQTLPGEFKRGPAQMVFFTSDNAAIDYGDSLASRATDLGDQTVLGGRFTQYRHHGSPLIPVPEIPEDLGVGGNETVAIHCDPKNMHIGLQRDLLIETDKDISSRQYIIVATVKMDAKYAHEPQTVIATGIRADPGA